MRHASDIAHVPPAELEDGLDTVRPAPSDIATVESIVRRPAENEREMAAVARLDPIAGPAGDNRHLRPTSHHEDESARPQTQLTLPGARAAALVAGARERRPLAGDQPFVELDPSHTNLPPATAPQAGPAALENTPSRTTGTASLPAGSASLR